AVDPARPQPPDLPADAASVPPLPRAQPGGLPRQPAPARAAARPRRRRARLAALADRRRVSREPAPRRARPPAAPAADPGLPADVQAAGDVGRLLPGDAEAGGGAR